MSLRNAMALDRALMRAALAAAVALGTTLASTPADAAGMYFSERGVRPLGRAGAFVAGADDLNALWYNPAGLSEAGSQFLFDASWVSFRAEYTRQASLTQRDPNTGEPLGELTKTFPTVEGSSPFMVLPSMAGSFKLADRWVMALGVFTPYAPPVSYPDTVDGAPAPSRHALISMEGTGLVVAGAWLSFAPTDTLRFGAGFQVYAGRLEVTKMLGTCVPDRFTCAPEQPDYDAFMKLRVGPIVAPSGNVGFQWIAHPSLRVGASFQAPAAVRASGDVQVRLPSASLFERARMEGDEVDVAFDLPWTLRMGVETRPIEGLRVELAAAVEGWSMHDEIQVTPRGVQLRDVVGFPDPYFIESMSELRNFRDAFSLRLGGEYTAEAAGMRLTPRGGLSYESSAVESAFLAAFPVDLPKVSLNLGMSVGVGAWDVDFVYAHVFGFEALVEPTTAKIPQVNPLRGQVSSPHVINGGSYRAQADIVGLGLRYAFDHEPSALPSEEARLGPLPAQ